MIRKTISKDTIKNGFRLRGHEVKRIEAFSDAVFAFAVTLLIVSLEVPKNFEELLTALHGFLPFGISFLFLMLIWHEQNVFFRRYAMDDTLIITLNCALVFIVLFFVYPLKFLFTLIFSDSHSAMTIEQSPILMTIYGAGFTIIYFIFFLMYRVALSRSAALELTALEKFETGTKMYVHLIFMFIGSFSILLTWLLPLEQSGLAGLFYCVIGPVVTIYFNYRSKKKRQLQL
ncbi:MAG TPA: TMEM175 family protein [Parafilimonas sp.]|jgi:uncharacterized membrane protein